MNARLNSISGSGVTVEQKLTAQANSITGLSGQAVFAVNVNGKVTGIKAASTASDAGATSDVDILADNFKLSSASAPSKTMFTVGLVNGVTEIGLLGNVHIDGALSNRALASGAAQTADIFSSFSGSTKVPFVMPRTGTVIIKARISSFPGETYGINLYYEGSSGFPGSLAASGTYYETGSSTGIRDVWIVKQLSAGNYWLGAYDVTNPPLDAFVSKFIA